MKAYGLFFDVIILSLVLSVCPSYGQSTSTFSASNTPVTSGLTTPNFNSTAPTAPSTTVESLTALTSTLGNGTTSTKVISASPVSLVNDNDTSQSNVSTTDNNTTTAASIFNPTVQIKFALLNNHAENVTSTGFQLKLAKSLAQSYSNVTSTRRRKRAASAVSSDGEYNVTVLDTSIDPSNEVTADYTVKRNGIDLSGTEASALLAGSSDVIVTNLQAENIAVQNVTSEPAVVPLETTTTQLFTNAIDQLSTISGTVTKDTVTIVSQNTTTLETNSSITMESVTSSSIPTTDTITTNTQMDESNVTVTTDLTPYLVELNLKLQESLFDSTELEKNTANMLALYYNETYFLPSSMNRKKRAIVSSVIGDFNVSIIETRDKNTRDPFFNYTLKINDTLINSDEAITRLNLQDPGSLHKLQDWGLIAELPTIENAIFRAVSSTTTGITETTTTQPFTNTIDQSSTMSGAVTADTVTIVSQNTTNLETNTNITMATVTSSPITTMDNITSNTQTDESNVTETTLEPSITLNTTLGIMSNDTTFVTSISSSVPITNNTNQFSTIAPEFNITIPASEVTTIDNRTISETTDFTTVSQIGTTLPVTSITNQSTPVSTTMVTGNISTTISDSSTNRIVRFKFVLSNNHTENVGSNDFQLRLARSLAQSYSNVTSTTRRKRAASAVSTDGQYNVTVLDTSIDPSNEVTADYTVKQNGIDLSGTEASAVLARSSDVIVANLRAENIAVQNITSEPAVVLIALSTTTTSNTAETITTQPTTNLVDQLSTTSGIEITNTVTTASGNTTVSETNTSIILETGTSSPNTTMDNITTNTQSTINNVSVTTLEPTLNTTLDMVANGTTSMTPTSFTIPITNNTNQFSTISPEFNSTIPFIEITTNNNRTGPGTVSPDLTTLTEITTLQSVTNFTNQSSTISTTISASNTTTNNQTVTDTVNTSTASLLDQSTDFTLNMTTIETTATNNQTILDLVTSNMTTTSETSTIPSTSNFTDQSIAATTEVSITNTTITDNQTIIAASSETSTFTPFVSVTAPLNTTFDLFTSIPISNQTAAVMETTTISVNNATSTITSSIVNVTASMFETSTFMTATNVTSQTVPESTSLLPFTNQSTSFFETSTALVTNASDQFTTEGSEINPTDSLFTSIGTSLNTSTGVTETTSIVIGISTNVPITVFTMQTGISNTTMDTIVTAETTTSSPAVETTTQAIVDIIYICQFRFIQTTPSVIDDSFNQVIAESLAATFNDLSTSFRRKRSVSATNGTYTVTVLNSELIDSSEVETNFTVTENNVSLTGQDAAQRLENSTTIIETNMNSRNLNVSSISQNPTAVVKATSDTTTAPTLIDTINPMVTESTAIPIVEATTDSTTDLTPYLVELSLNLNEGVNDGTDPFIVEKRTALMLALYYNETSFLLSPTNRKKRAIASRVIGDFNVSIEGTRDKNTADPFLNYTLRINDTLINSDEAIKELYLQGPGNLSRLIDWGENVGLGTIKNANFRAVSSTLTGITDVTSLVTNVTAFTSFTTNATEGTTVAVPYVFPWYLIVIIVLGIVCLILFILAVFLCYKLCCREKADKVAIVGQGTTSFEPPLPREPIVTRDIRNDAQPVPPPIPIPGPEVHVEVARPLLRESHRPEDQSSIESEETPRPKRKPKAERLPPITTRRVPVVHKPSPSASMSSDPLVPKFRSTIHPIILPPINSVISRDMRDSLTEDAIMHQRREIERHKNKVRLRRRASKPYSDGRDDINRVLDPGTPDVFKKPHRKRYHRTKGKLNLGDPTIIPIEPTGRYHQDFESSSTDSGVTSPETTRKKMASLLADAFNLISPSAQKNMVGPTPPMVVQPAPAHDRPLMHHPDGRTSTPHHRVMTPAGYSTDLAQTPTGHSSLSIPSPGNSEVLFTRRQPPIVMMPPNGDIGQIPAVYSGPTQSGKPLYITPIRQQMPPGDDSQSPVWTPYRTYDSLARMQSQPNSTYGNTNYNNNNQPVQGDGQFLHPGSSGSYQQPHLGTNSPLPGTMPTSIDLNESYFPPPQTFQTTLPSDATSSGFEPGTSRQQEPHPSAAILQSIKDELAKISGRSSTPVQNITETEPNDIATRDYGKESEA